ncbi:hypothetical protein BDQ17DRAFT_1324211 [Cyathus striatus]|nr:hypothetical protein BDQ17DRAFT_1324211 [Cyathus striatus]
MSKYRFCVTDPLDRKCTWVIEEPAKLYPLAKKAGEEESFWGLKNILTKKTKAINNFNLKSFGLTAGLRKEEMLRIGTVYILKTGGNACLSYSLKPDNTRQKYWEDQEATGWDFGEVDIDVWLAEFRDTGKTGKP